MTDTVNQTQKGWILCRDERLCRLLESELSYLGIAAVSYSVLPSPSSNAILLLWDGDEFSPAEGVALSEACGCPLLVFGRELAALPLPADRRARLRRPFSLTELEKTVRSLLADRPLLGSLAGMASSTQAPAVPAPSTLTAQNGTVTVGERTVNLTPAEWVVFAHLYDHRGESVSREELSTLLGGGGNSVDVYICHLRNKIEKPLGRRMIHTVRGVGYRMETT